jgi:hypothetical protein
VLLCGFHHRLVHEHGWRLRSEPGGEVDWYRPDGRRHRAGPAPPRMDVRPGDPGRTGATRDEALPESDRPPGRPLRAALSLRSGEKKTCYTSPKGPLTCGFAAPERP